MIKFKYNGKIFAPSNFEKKLQKLGITKDDIEIIEEEKEVILNDTKLYYFYNPINKHTITSCLPDLEQLRDVKGYNVNEWVLFEPNK